MRILILVCAYIKFSIRVYYISYACIMYSMYTEFSIHTRILNFMDACIKSVCAHTKFTVRWYYTKFNIILCILASITCILNL